MDTLKELRERIDWLDTQIASLLNERMSATDQVGRIKSEMHLNVNDPSREINVLNHVETVVQHPILKTTIANIYGEIMLESKVAQQFFKYVAIPFRRIGIIGLGLIGGSICKGIKIKDPTIKLATVSYPSDDNALAVEGGWIDTEYATIADLIQNTDLLILATPISTIIHLAEEIQGNCTRNEKLIVIDIASVKKDIVASFEKLSNEHVEFISTHPMAGKETQGFANSQATLFVNRPWIVVPHDKNSQHVLEGIEEFIHFLGSDLISLNASVHDQQAALVSHLPFILAKSYFTFVTTVDPESIRLAGPSFQAFTRLAHDNQVMWAEILQSNHEVIQSYVDQWLDYIKKV